MPNLNVFKSKDAEARFMALYDTRVGEWPVQRDELDLPTRFGPTHVIASGCVDAPPLILLACGMGTATVWRANIAGLSARFRTFAIDVIGEPNKSKPTARLQSRRDFADWLLDVLDALHVDRACIVGNSYGGFLALNQASLTPNRIERVVLISPAGVFARSRWPFYLPARFIYYYFVAALFRSKTLLARGHHEWMRNGAPRDPHDATWDELMMIAMFEGRIVNRVLPSIFDEEELRRIASPILLLIGDREAIWPPDATLRRASRRMPSIKGEIVSNADHVAAMAQPDVVNERIIRFLSMAK